MTKKDILLATPAILAFFFILLPLLMGALVAGIHIVDLVITEVDSWFPPIKAPALGG